MNILLCCGAGMSSSLLAQKMEKEAANQGITAKVWAVSAAEVKEEIKKADVLLIGPQIRYKLTEFKGLGKENGVPVEMIPTRDYGMINGKAVLEFALKLINNK